MGYRRMKRRDLWEIYRRWRAGQSVRRIAETQERDRKTVREYLAGMRTLGVGTEGGELEQQEFYRRVEALLPQQTERPSPARGELERHRAEIHAMVNRAEDPLKPKSAFIVIKKKYEIAASYETFKRFARQEGLSRPERRRMIRIELPPGLQTQLDYGKMGMLPDGVSGRNMLVWAFCAVLAHSRYPFVQFVRSQDQRSFVGSVVDMFEYYEGVTETLSVDNLKSGVIKPDLWDPQLNRAFAEAADHYGVFIDPTRVARATDKGKIERFVPVARELFRMLKELHPGAGLAELNRQALHWCRQEYGRREHGTTGIRPAEAYEEERAHLKRLPAERFDVPVWKELTVHGGDQFLTFAKMRFSLPPQWRGRTVWTRYSAPILRLFDQEEHLIRQYVVRAGQRRYWHPNDFPPEVRQMMNGGYPSWILQQARAYGTAATALIAAVLEPHAYLNARRARGMLTVMAEHHGKPYFDGVCRSAKNHTVRLPATLKRMLEAAAAAEEMQRCLPISELGTQMVRDIRYYLN